RRERVRLTLARQLRPPVNAGSLSLRSKSALTEVKTRRVGSGVDGWRPVVGAFDAIHPRKRHRVRNMAHSWLNERAQRPYADVLRFDAIGVTLDRAGALVSIEHLEGAF